VRFLIDNALSPAVEDALASLDRGERIPIEQVKAKISAL
jgi:hypothetical protein